MNSDLQVVEFMKNGKDAIIAKQYKLAESQMAVADEFIIKWKIE